MGVLGPPLPKRIKIEVLKKVTSLVLWSPFVISVVLVILFALVRLVIECFHANEVHLRRWKTLRDSLAQITSGGEFFGVYMHQSIEQATSYNDVQRGRSNVPEEKDLFMAERRIPAQRKGAWFNIYLLLLPLQVAIITIIIVHNIYTIQYSTETCESFAAIANSLNQSSYYDCKYDTLSDNNSDILRKCNETGYGNQIISCTTYYYDPLPSHVILTILNSLLLHLTLSKGFVRFIIIMRYVSHKYGKSCQKNCPCQVHGAFIVAMVLLSIAGVALIYYALTDGERVESDVTTSIVLFAFTTIAISIVLFLFGLFQPNLYKPFTRCSYNVTDDPKIGNDPIMNDTTNQETDDENDPMTNKWFCCSLPTKHIDYNRTE